MAVGRVFGRAFAAARHNWAPTLAVTLLFAGLPLVIAYYAMAQVPWQYMVVTIGSIYLPGAFANGVARWFISLLLGVIAQGAMTRLVVAAGEGRKATVGESLAAASRTALPLTIMGAVIGVSVIIGTSLLLIPGLLIFALWATAPSIEADEREGVFLALSRSQELAEGARWKVLAIVLLLLGLSILFLFLSGLLSGLLFLNGMASLSGQIAIRVAVSTIMNAFWGAVLASLYVELKQWQEGDSVESLGEVFA